ncbi:uncharacterized protein LOC120246583 [Hyaena hyaena]|uniref:uncharacterized protein LOC120246583 n=1 Tax=Hyaena hyaena TaxID=95912 RepID=UPI001920DF11|nr:uncharacterized protein LOC120246583 [Hyaena hyaena]
MSPNSYLLLIPNIPEALFTQQAQHLFPATGDLSFGSEGPGAAASGAGGPDSDHRLYAGGARHLLEAGGYTPGVSAQCPGEAFCGLEHPSAARHPGCLAVLGGGGRGTDGQLPEHLPEVLQEQVLVASGSGLARAAAPEPADADLVALLWPDWLPCGCPSWMFSGTRFGLVWRFSSPVTAIAMGPHGPLPSVSTFSSTCCDG